MSIRALWPLGLMAGNLHSSMTTTLRTTASAEARLMAELGRLKMLLESQALVILARNICRVAVAFFEKSIPIPIGVEL